MRLAIKPFYTLIFVSFIALIYSNGYAQTNSNYLRLLEGEASNLILDSQPKSKQLIIPQDNSTSSISEIGKIPKGLSFDGFMKNIKVNYIGTYLFTKRLSATQQNEIYTFYQKNNDPQAIRTHVIKTSKKK